MKKFVISIIIAVLCLVSNETNAQENIKKDLVDYVDPNIGGIGQLLASTDPIVKMPGGMVELSPNPWPEVMNRCDRYLAAKVTSFSILDVPIYAKQATPTWIMATTGDLETDPDKMASRYDHDFEIVTPYYSSLLLEDYDITVENTATKNAAFYRFTFPKHAESQILFGADTEISIVDNAVVEGKSRGTYLYMKFSKPLSSAGTWKENKIYPEAKSQSGSDIGVYANYATSEGEQIEVKIGISKESLSIAKQNLENEIAEQSFEEVKKQGRDTWNKSLSIVQVEGGTEEQLRIFYTGLYFIGGGEIFLEDMCIRTEGLTKKANKITNRPSDKLFPAVITPDCMFTQPNICQIGKMYTRGIRDFDIERAFNNMKKEFMGATRLPWKYGPKTELDEFYLENGFFPALAPGEKETVAAVNRFEKRQSVTLTLQAAYESWCVAQLAKDLGKEEDYEYFMKHAYDYQNVFDTTINFVAPKTADGNWIRPFDPMLSGGQGGRFYFAEMNAWLYTWYITHDIQGLINLMGGREPFINKLDELFDRHYQEKVSKYDFYQKFPDMTGLVGMYTHGDEFARHIPYLYNYAGVPWKTQRRVREIMKVCYDDDIYGMCGDEDHGALSIWYVFGAMGLYSIHMNSAYPVWLIGSPIFKKTTIDFGKGKTLAIEAKNVSNQNKYIQSAKFNGKTITATFLNHSDIVDGGNLELVMGPRPNKEWGSAIEDAPPSMSKPN